MNYNFTNTTYKNISNLPLGVYQNKNYELNQNKFYVKVDGQSLDIKFLKDLKNHPLNPEIYDNPNYWPLLQRDTSVGSAFTDFHVPTGSYKFIVSEETIEVVKSVPSISYEEYVDKSYDIIGDEIKNIFEIHDEVVVTSNGGIDSLVLLSYIMKMGFLKKVRILNQYNSVSRTASPNALYDLNQLAYEKFENYFTPLVKEFRHTTLTKDDLIYIINNYDYEKLKCYSTTTMFLNYSNVGFLFGFAGNQTLLHHTPILDMVYDKSKLPNAKEILHSLLVPKNYYSASPLTHGYDVNKTNLCNIEIFTYQYKPWYSFDGFNNNKMYYPLGSISHLGRILDYSTVDFDTILNARMCREIINRNVGNLFEDFIKVTTPYDSDHFVNIQFDKTIINPDALVIPKQLNHDPKKLLELETRLKSDTIDHFTISVIKMLQHMDQLLNI
jgi:hypothetical protein